MSTQRESDQFLQGGGVFDITDYTTASDWERFIASLEETFTEWNLHNQTFEQSDYQELPKLAISKGIWHEKFDTLKFGQFTFDIKYQYLNESNLFKQSSTEEKTKSETETETKQDGSDITDGTEEQEFEPAAQANQDNEKEYQEHELPKNTPQCLLDLLSTNNDFSSKAHCLVRWYNLRKFFILIPRGDTVMSEDKVKLLLSSASIALSNINCHIPLFVQIHNPKSHFYQGISEHQNIRTMYEMVYYNHGLRQYSYLSELINMFREKTSCNLSDPIDVSVRLNYCLDFFDLFLPPREHFEGNEHSDDEQPNAGSSVQSKLLTKKKPITQDMRSGATFEQVVEELKDCLPHPYKILKFIHIAPLWPPVSDKVIADTPVHSDLDPAEAPIWLMRCITRDNCNMKIVHETQAVHGLLCKALDYAFDVLDGSTVFQGYGREELREKCLRFSYKLSVSPEVLLSDNVSDPLRKLMALIFYQAEEVKKDNDALSQIANQLKKKPSLLEIYRDFMKKQKPSVKEFIIRSRISRPFNPFSSPALPQRMFCTICDDEFRLCGAFSELCN